MDLSGNRCLIEEGNEKTKCCTDCKTTKTPLWRGGPAGPKSLCNACGIKHRKKRRDNLNINREQPKKKKDKSDKTSTKKIKIAKKGHNNTNGFIDNNKSLKIRLVSFGTEVLLGTPSSLLPNVIVKKQRCQRRRKLREEEQAAFSLIALSSGGSVSAH